MAANELPCELFAFGGESDLALLRTQDKMQPRELLHHGGHSGIGDAQNAGQTGSRGRFLPLAYAVNLQQTIFRRRG